MHSQMKKTLQLLALGLFLTICSYGQRADIDINKIDSINQINSLLLENILKDALVLANEVLYKNHYSTEYDIQNNDSSIVVTVNITIGHLFSQKQRHLLIRRITLWCEYIDLYFITDDVLKSVIYREQYGMTYINDTIRDINGDGINDFVVHWYPSSGCCRQDVYSVYLNQPDKGIFSKEYRFINPTFSPKEKIVRGVEYGYPGEAGLYKYKWDGLNLAPIEFIYPDVNNKGQFIRTKTSAYRPTEKEGEMLNAVPEEYHKIEGYDWFADF